MLKRLIRAIRYFFTLNKAEQRGIVVLVFLILLVSTVYFVLPFFFKSSQTDLTEFKTEINSFREEQQEIRDSIRIIYLQNSGQMDRELALRKIKPFKFDPNKLPAEAWKAMGLTKKQIRSIKNYEAGGGHFRRKTDLKKMRAISDIEYEILEPYIQIKSPFMSGDERYLGDRKESYYKRLEINKADSALLVKRLRLAPWLAARVVKYRNLLGGFYQAQQLREVYGFDSLALVKRRDAIRVDANLVKTLDLNKASFKELVRHPYISYELTQYIVNTRKKNSFKSIEVLQQSPLVSESLFFKVKPYLSVSE